MASRLRSALPAASRAFALVLVLFVAGCVGSGADKGAVLRGWLGVETQALPLPAGDGILVLGGGYGGPRVGVVEPGRVRWSVAPDEPAGGPENGRAIRADFSPDRAFVAILTHDGQGKRAITLAAYALRDGASAWELPLGATRLLGFGLARGMDRVVVVHSTPGEGGDATITLAEADTGRVAVRANVGARVAGVLVLDDHVLVHHFDAIEAFDTTDGRRLWRTELPMYREDEWTTSSVRVTGLFRAPGGVHARLGTALVALLSTIDPATGALGSYVRLPGDGDVHVAPLATGASLVARVTNDAARLYLADPAGGEVTPMGDPISVWKREAWSFAKDPVHAEYEFLREGSADTPPAYVVRLQLFDPVTGERGAFADRVHLPGNHVIAAAATPGRMFFVTSSDRAALHVEDRAPVSG